MNSSLIVTENLEGNNSLFLNSSPHFPWHQIFLTHGSSTCHAEIQQQRETKSSICDNK